MAVGALEDGVVIRIDMTCGTHAIGVAVIRGEGRVLGVIESRIQPAAGVVTGDTRGREKLRLGGVAGIRRRLVIGLVAAVTIRGQGGVVVVDVAIHALPRRRGVHAGQGERSLVVIENAVGPEHGVMAQLAGRGEADGNVVNRALRVVVIGQVAADASRSREVVVVVDVAVGAQARRHGVHAGQIEPGRSVVEDGVQPRGRAVTLFASLREV